MLGLDGEEGVGEGAEPLLCMLWLVLVPHLCATQCACDILGGLL